MQASNDTSARQQQNLQEATPSYLPRTEIESFAEKISEEFRLTDFSQTDDPLASFTKKIGGRIHYQDPADFVASESGSIKVWGQNDFDVYLSTFTGPLRDRFTLAHELGHYFVHSGQGEKLIRATRKGSGQLEWEANWFAASLLMPSQKFRQVASAFGNDVSAIAGHFQVSSQAVEIRLKRIK